MPKGSFGFARGLFKPRKAPGREIALAPVPVVQAPPATFDLDRYFAAEASRSPRFCGQLRGEFQTALAERYAGIRIEDCDFSHSFELLDGEIVSGDQDFCGAEDDCLGGLKIWGKRVLELFPGSGFMSAHLASRADELVVFDAPIETETVTMQSRRPGVMPPDERLRRGWWFARRAIGYEAHAVYADITDPPSDLGRFDVVVLMGSLSRAADPITLLRHAADIAHETVVVTDLVGDELPAAAGEEAAPTAILTVEPGICGAPHWLLSPTAVEQMLASAGLHNQAVTFHAPPQMPSGKRLYTLVAQRNGPARIARSADPKLLPAREPPPSVAPKPALQLGGPLVRIPVPPPALTTADLPASAVAPGDLAYPPAAGRVAAVGSADIERFAISGRVTFRLLQAALRRASQPERTLGRVLEFGCGFGRILRFWSAYPSVEVHGADVDAAAVGWCRENLRFGAYRINGLIPPLSYPTGYFDFAYAIGVFDEFETPERDAWLAEMVRVIRPGGHLYVSVSAAPAEEVALPDGVTLVERRAEGTAGTPGGMSWLVRKSLP